ncbi:MAG: 30S ribosomal protein S3 [Chloroflexi bacterium]|nr:30S ribosomal protein S3 [Chloroflexota bacterium]MCC6896219.1 30S ribosomal protein S3 [Anaerolineae bacterium]
MGRKVHPIGFRLKITRDWDARWYAEGSKFRELLQEDFKIRRFVKKLGLRAGVSRVEIERYPNQLLVNIHTAKPGILIGRKGEAVKDLRTGIESITDKKVKVEVTEIEKPDLDPILVAENIVDQLERRIGHSRAMKRAISQAMRQGAQGIKIEVAGRLAGGDMARREWASEGRVPRSSLRSDLDFGTAEALTTFGRIGVKVWIYKGEILKQEDKPEPKKDVYVTP